MDRAWSYGSPTKSGHLLSVQTMTRSVPSPALRTAGEQLVGHPLTAERKGGVPHYLPGQHHAGIQMIDEEHGGGWAAALSYVDQMGHAVSVICEYEGGEWVPHMVARCGHTHGSFEAWAPADERRFKLSDKMLAVLEKARKAAGL